MVSGVIDAGLLALRNEMVRAAKEGDIEQLRVLLQQQADLPGRSANSASDDSTACMNGLCSIGVTPLYMAALKGNASVARLLLASGASPIFPTAKGRTPLFASLLGDSLEIAKLLVEAGASIESDVGGELLFEATRRGRFDIAHWLLANDVSVQFASPVTGMTPLFAAASFGNVELAATFLDRGALINARTVKGQTPLFVAALLGYMTMTQFLIERGAEVDAVAANGESPLFAAAGWGHLDVARELIQRGAVVDRRNCRGETPLFVAITRGSAAIAAFLITECGAELDLQTLSGDTLLSIARLSDQPEIVKILQDRAVEAK